MNTRREERKRAALEKQIDENLRRVYEQETQQEVPDRFLILLERLREQDPVTAARTCGEARARSFAAEFAPLADVRAMEKDEPSGTTLTFWASEEIFDTTDYPLNATEDGDGLRIL